MCSSSSCIDEDVVVVSNSDATRLSTKRVISISFDNVSIISSKFPVEVPFKFVCCDVDANDATDILIVVDAAALSEFLPDLRS